MIAPIVSGCEYLCLCVLVERDAGDVALMLHAISGRWHSKASLFARNRHHAEKILSGWVRQRQRGLERFGQ